MSIGASWAIEISRKVFIVRVGIIWRKEGVAGGVITTRSLVAPGRASEVHVRFVYFVTKKLQRRSSQLFVYISQLLSVFNQVSINLSKNYCTFDMQRGSGYNSYNFFITSLLF